MVGHRGYGAGEPGGYRENSLESFLAAVHSGLTWLELDVQRSADGVLVVRHDPMTPDGTPVVAVSAADLAARGVHRLDDVLAALPAAVGVNIDVKTIFGDATDPPEQRTSRLLADALQRYLGTRSLLASSFDPSVLTYLRMQPWLSGEIALGLLGHRGLRAQHAIPAAANLWLDVVCLHTGTFNLEGELAAERPEQIIGAAHRAGLEVLAWVPTPAQAVRLARAGADAVCVDDVPGALSALAGGP